MRNAGRPGSRVAQPADRLEPVDAGQLRRDQREVEPARGRERLDLAQRLLAGDVRERRDPGGLEPVGELVGDRAIVLDQQHRGRRLSTRTRPRRWSGAGCEASSSVDRAALGADQILQQILDHVAQRRDRRDLGATLAPGARQIRWTSRARVAGALELEIDHVAGAGAHARDDQHRIGVAGDHDRQRVRDRGAALRIASVARRRSSTSSVAAVEIEQDHGRPSACSASAAAAPSSSVTVTLIPPARSRSTIAQRRAATACAITIAVGSTVTSRTIH